MPVDNMRQLAEAVSPGLMMYPVKCAGGKCVFMGIFWVSEEHVMIEDGLKSYPVAARVVMAVATKTPTGAGPLSFAELALKGKVHIVRFECIKGDDPAGPMMQDVYCKLVGNCDDTIPFKAACEGRKAHGVAYIPDTATTFPNSVIQDKRSLMDTTISAFVAAEDAPLRPPASLKRQTVAFRTQPFGGVGERLDVYVTRPISADAGTRLASNSGTGLAVSGNLFEAINEWRTWITLPQS